MSLDTVREPLVVLLAGWSSGISIYLTVALLGAAGKFGWMTLPGEMQSLSNPLIFGAAFIVFLIEFVADKVPYVDSVWDSFHTVIRPLGGVALGWLGTSQYGPAAQTLFAILTGTITLNMHTLKAAGRLAINTSPEPFSNIAASTVEQASVCFMFWFFIKHPILAALLIVAILVVAFLIIRMLWRFVLKLFRRKPAPAVTSASPPAT